MCSLVLKPWSVQLLGGRGIDALSAPLTFEYYGKQQRRSWEAYVEYMVVD